MSNQARYISSTGEVFELDGPVTYIGTADNIRADKHGYTLGYRTLSGITREAREETVEAYFSDLEEADRFRRITDKDMYYGTPGTFEMKGWRQRAYISNKEPSEIARKHHKQTLTVILLDGVWGKWHKQSFNPRAEAEESKWLDLPTDAPFDLMATPGVDMVENTSLIPSPVKITIFGQAINPFITIGDNRYEVDATVPSGARIEIDGTVYPRTISLISALGEKTDLFSSGVRGSGEGSGEYVFETLKPGYHSNVSWSGGWGFDLEWLELDGTPPWT